jgi:hypothetical protein
LLGKADAHHMSIVSLAVELARQQDGVLTVKQAKDLGLTRAAVETLVRNRHWRRPIQGIILVPGICDKPDRIRARAACLRYSQGVVSQRTSARFWDLDGLPRRVSSEPIAVNLPRSDPRSPCRGMLFTYASVGDGDATEVDGIRVMTPLRTLAQLEATETKEIAVCTAESAIRKKLITLDDLPPGSPWSFVDPKSKTPIETLIRLPLVAAGIGPLISQYAIDCDEIVLYADLALPEYRIALEADGRGHEGGDQFVWDRRRDVLLAEAGWRVIRFSWRDAMIPGYVVQTVLRAIAMVA